MTPAFTISDTETLILALSGREWLLVSCQLSIVGKKDILELSAPAPVVSR
jgi:hypothetical protein